MDSLLSEIISDATNSDKSLSNILRKCKVLGFKLKHETLKEWVNCELNGYGPEAKLALPPYRIINGNAFGIFHGPFSATLENYPIPPAVLDDQHQDWARVAKLNGPIASYEALDFDKPDSSPRIRWPGNLVLYYQEKIVENYALVAAWLSISSPALMGMLDTVRNRILDFALEMSEAFPTASADVSLSEQHMTVEKLVNKNLLGKSHPDF